MTDDRKERLFGKYPKHVLQRFKTHHMDNPDIFEDFTKLAHQMKASGRRKYSSEFIINKIRWDRDIKTKGDVFKINNDYKSLYARLLVYKDPDFEDFFEFRETPCKGIKSTEQRIREDEDR